MTAEEATRAFDRFWRAETSRTRTGSGLGLPIAQAIVNAHGGTICLATTPREGTTVRVELPLQADHHLPTPELTPQDTRQTVGYLT
jgi:two-component system, OmpR family, sensor kinase